MSWAYALSGAAAGVAQAALLGRSARRATDPLGLLVRLAVVAAVLLIGARAGHALLVAGAWLAGLACAAPVVHRSLK